MKCYEIVYITVGRKLTSYIFARTLNGAKKKFYSTHGYYDIRSITIL